MPILHQRNHPSPRFGWGLLALVAVCFTWHCMSAASTSTPPAPVDFSVNLDPVFTNASAAVRQANGLRALETDVVFPEWRTNLCLLLGCRVDAGSSRFVNLIEITTLPALTSAGTNGGQHPDQLTLTLTCPPSALISTSRVHRLVSPRYPVRLRVYDQEGRFLKESRENFAWFFLTNGIAPGCLILKAVNNAPAGLSGGEKYADTTPSSTPTAAASATVELQLKMEQATLGSLTSLVALFAGTLSSDSLEGLRDHAYEVVRTPSLFKVVADFGLNLNLEPRFEDAVLLPALEPGAGGQEPHVWLPVELKQGQRVLVSVSFIAGSTTGPYFLTSGVRAVRAVHPTKADHSMLAQVLAVGEVTRDARPVSAPEKPARAPLKSPKAATQ